MTEKQWKSKIKKNCKDAGTYRRYFEPVIETLAGILSKRDEALEQFLASGGKVIVLHTNKGGATNLIQNPALRLVNDLNRDALMYWRELGLTAASLRKINEQAIRGSAELSPLDKALMELGS
ncbi:MAG: P27 family phage terminase small subunit [Ruminococcus sp.]|nr:P27 family phage terminase small subunit [Ruminococcus sp.]